MCGINGIISAKDNAVTLKKYINRMNDKIIHRGPDSDGVYVKDGLALGMRRLSIIDLSNGDQPIFNEDKSLVIVFNGEIYNFKELKNKLLDLGHRFYTNSDTEVVIHLYEEYGTNSFSMLDGMFAFAIYDMKKNIVTIARDRAGEKPLYYYKASDTFIFSSSIKSIFEYKNSPSKINEQALSVYFQLTYIPSPMTIFENIFKLNAGNYLEFDNNSLTINSYFDLIVDKNKFISNVNECQKKLRETLIQSVESRFVSDVPVGAFLSGGIDSTIVCGIATKILGKKIETFTIGKEDKEDESPLAKISSRHFGTKHHCKIVTDNDFDKVLPDIIGKLDEPFADSSVVPTYLVSQYAAQYTKVVLTGDGGDELFAGYNRYLLGYYIQNYSKFPSIMRKLFEVMIKSLPQKSHSIQKIHKVLRASKLNDKVEQHLSTMCLGCQADMIQSVLNYKVDSNALFDSIPSLTQGTEELDIIDQALVVDFKCGLEGDMFTKVDRMSMANSLEARAPFVSSKMINLAYSIPYQYKINGKNKKIILKETFKDIIPNEILHAPKRGFSVEIHTFLKTWYLQNRNSFSEVTKYYVNLKTIDSVVKHGNYSNDSFLWTLFIFDKWAKDNIKIIAL